MNPPIATRIALCLAVGAFLLSACTGDSVLDAPATPSTYDLDGIRFTHPSDWPVLEGMATPDGRAPRGPVVGSLDGAGNVVGLSIEVQTIDPIPPGEERNYLEAAFSRNITEIWGDGVIRDEGWDTVAGREARRSLIDHTARGMALTSEVLVAASATTSFTVQCQAPTAVFWVVASRCSSILDSLEFSWPGEDSPGTTGN